MQADARAAVDELALLELVIDDLTDALVVLDDAGIVRWRRRTVRDGVRLAGNHAVIGRPLLDRVHADDLPVVLSAIERVLRGEIDRFAVRTRVFDATDPELLHDGDIRVIDARDVPGINGVVAVADIRDTRRAFADQVHGDDFSLGDAAPVGLAIVSPTERLVYANRNFRTHLGLGDRSAITVTAVEGLHELIATVRERGHDERVLSHRDRTLRATGQRFGDHGGSIALSTADVSAEYEAIAARRRSEETWRATFDHTPAGMALLDVDGRFREINRSWTMITGYTAEDLVGRPFADITHPDDLDTDLAHVEDLLSGRRRAYRMRKRYHHRGGSVIWVDLWGALVRSSEGEPLHFVAQILEADPPDG